MNRHSVMYRISYLVLSIVLLMSAACSITAAPMGIDCTSSSIKPAPTTTRSNDPDLSQAPDPASGGNIGTFCPTPVPQTTSVPTPLDQFQATELVNLSLSSANQEIEAVAVGDDMLAVAWLTDGDIYLALSRGGSHFQVRHLDQGEAVSLIFSTVNRLHVAYEKDGQLFYRAADQGVHPAEIDSEFVADGSNPKLLLNQFNYAQIVFEVADQFHHAAQFMHESWQIGRIDGAYAGSNARFTPFGSDLEFGYLIAYRGVGGEIHLARWHTTPYGFFPSWQPLKTLSMPSGETLHSNINVDYLSDGGDQWAVASWTTFRPNPNAVAPAFAQPIFEPANPLYPNQLANPHHIYAGLNAARWHNDPLQPTPYAAGLYQSVSVASGAFVHFSAWGMGNSNLRIGIDPTGKTDPHSPTIRWSTRSTVDVFTEFSVSTVATGSQVTVFLEGMVSTPDVAGITLWDKATVPNGLLLNGGFEDVFTTQNGLTLPDSWTAYSQDGSFTSTMSDAVYTVYTAWSRNGGIDWSAPIEVVQNRESGGSLSGAIPADPFPLLSTATATPTVSLVYLYAAGNPPADSAFIRFGRPFIAQCDLLSADCTAGDPLLDRQLVRPVSHFLVAKDTLDPSRATLVWTSRQSDLLAHDIFATHLVLR